VSRLDKLYIFTSAFLFGIGLEISQMTDPNKVIGFLDVFGKWDPSLCIVMVGAIFVNSIFYYLIQKKKTYPINNEISKQQVKTIIDTKLIVGASLFGVGWGVSGFCPGPLLANIYNLQPEIFVSILSMFVGFFIYHKFFDQSHE
jgi:uncharacterized protein